MNFNLPSYILVNYDEKIVLDYAKTLNPADVFYLRKQEDHKYIVVEDVERFIDQTKLASVGARKLFIIFDAHLMNEASQNKILKTLEDLENTTVILLCSNDRNLLPTIKSRCVTLQNSKKHETPEIINKLEEFFPTIEKMDRAEYFKALAIINRNVEANCNEVNAYDLLAIKSLSK